MRKTGPYRLEMEAIVEPYERKSTALPMRGLGILKEEEPTFASNTFPNKQPGTVASLVCR